MGIIAEEKVLSWRELLNFESQHLPLPRLLLNIWTSGLEIGNRRKIQEVGLTPLNLHLLFKAPYVAGLADELFGITDLQKFEGIIESSLEWIVIDAGTKRRIHYYGQPALEDFDLEKGIYIPSELFVELLPEYTARRFYRAIANLEIPWIEYAHPHPTRLYLLDNTTLAKMPRFDITKDDKKRTVYTHDFFQKIIPEISEDNLDLKNGVWLTSRQIHKLVDHITPIELASALKESAAIQSKVINSERYLIDRQALDYIQVSQSLQQNIISLHLLFSIRTISEALEIHYRNLLNLQTNIKRPERTRYNSRHVNIRIEHAVACYYDFADKKSRALIDDRIFARMGKKFAAQTIRSNCFSFFTPYLRLYYDVWGLTREQMNLIKTGLKDWITDNSVDSIARYAKNNRCLPPEVKNNDYLPIRKQKLSNRHFFYLSLMRDFRVQTSRGLSKAVIPLRKVVRSLEPRQAAYLAERYCLSDNPDKLDWKVPIPVEFLTSVKARTACYLEQKMMEKLRQPEFSWHFEGFADAVCNYMKNLKAVENP